MNFSPERLLRILTSLPRPAVYWVAYSGGVDSSVLLHTMVTLRPQLLPAELKAIHVDHGLHAAAERWAAHCGEQCRVLGVPLLEKHLNLRPGPGESVEGVAREARLAVFRESIGPNHLLLTAQHRDDQAETLLLQLLRGSGLSGLAAMPRVASLPPGRLVRPLLDFDQGELQGYAQRNGIAWIDDSSNFDIGFDRNYLRHRVLPLIGERWPAFAKTFARSADHCAEAQGLIDRLVERELDLVRGRYPDSLKVSALRILDQPLCRAVLRYWIKAQGFRMPSVRHLDRIIHELLPAAPDRNPLVTWGEAEVRRYRDGLFVMRPLPQLTGSEVLSWNGGECLELPDGLGRLQLVSDQASGIDPARWGDAEVRVRFRAGGERCRPGGKRHHRLLKKLFQEWGVPDWLRPMVPLVFLDDELAAVGGFCVCDQGKNLSGPGVELRWEGHPWRGVLTM